ncbi:MAG: phosphoribosylformylglycinamidine cyclo-ligase [Candidatus Sumerlaeia bacterium]
MKRDSSRSNPKGKDPSPARGGKPTYASSGVDIAAGDALVDWLRARLPHIGGFSGLFPLARRRYREPLLVASTDGVGTKLMVAAMAEDYSAIGFDLVAMTVNDLVTCGAEPLFFLDYLGTSRLDAAREREIVDSIIRACDVAGCVLLGGETAEMPGFYRGDHVELAGFGVGIVERRKVIDGSRIRAGDVLIGVASSGLHSNGYSLVRRVVFDRARLKLSARPRALGGETVGEVLLRPTEIYVSLVRSLLAARVPVRGLAHITGGGIAGNLVRILPDGVRAEVRRGAWPVPAVFGWLRELGGISEEEMYRVFNMGVGLIAVVPARAAERAVALIGRSGTSASVIGRVTAGPREVVLI